MREDQTHFLNLKNINKTFKSDLFKPPAHVLKNLSYSIESQKFTGLIGPNGAGKTTSLKCLLEFIYPESGQITYPQNTSATEFKKKLGYLPERPYFQEFLTGLEFLKLHWKLSQAQGNFLDHAMAVLDQVKLTHAKDKFLKEYSKGMLQRIGIAQALIHQPHFLILDEPMSGLDPDGRILVKEVLKELKSKNLTVLMSSHLLEDIDELCENLVIIHEGECIFNGALLEFKKDFSSLQAAYKHFKGQFQVNYSV